MKRNGYTQKELLVNLFAMLLLVTTVIGGFKISFAWRGFWGAVLGCVVGCIIGFFALIGMIVTFVFTLALFRKIKNTKKQTENI